MTVTRYLADASKALSEAANTDLDGPIGSAINLLVDVLQNRKPLLLCGNGGSAADAMHISGELVGRFLLDRPPYKVISLGTDPVITSAWSNDFEYDSLFARNSESVVQAAIAAKKKGMATMAFTGRGGGRLVDVDILVAVPFESTPRIQEIHTCLYHYVCQRVENLLVNHE